MIFVDSDIFLDTILIRMPHASFADKLLSLQSRENAIQLATSAHCLLNVYYFTRKANSSSFAKSVIADLMRTIKVFPVSDKHLEAAVTSSITDFEDAVQHAVAVSNHCDTIITRNLKHYNMRSCPF